MSVLTCFGKNLRILAEEKGTLTAAANGLGFSKVQFQRFLNGASFPKPHHLEKICEYFDVDARILLEPLTDDLLAAMRHDRSGVATHANSAMLEAVEYSCATQDYFSETGTLDDGFYAVYRHSMARVGRFVRILLYVRTLEHVRVIRGYDNKLVYPTGTPTVQREFRGIVHKATDGYSIIFYHNPPEQFISMIHISPMAAVLGKSGFSGYNCLGRSSTANEIVYTDVYVEKLVNGVSDALKFRRLEPIIDYEELPSNAKELVFFHPKVASRFKSGNR